MTAKAGLPLQSTNIAQNRLVHPKQAPYLLHKLYCKLQETSPTTEFKSTTRTRQKSRHTLKVRIRNTKQNTCLLLSTKWQSWETCQARGVSRHHFRQRPWSRAASQLWHPTGVTPTSPSKVRLNDMVTKNHITIILTDIRTAIWIQILVGMIWWAWHHNFNFHWEKKYI